MKRLIAILLLTSTTCFLYAKTHEVGKDKVYKSIKSALAKIHNGDTVYVYEGIYKEGNIIIDKEVALIGIIICKISKHNNFWV